MEWSLNKMPQVDNMEAVRILAQERWEFLNATHNKHARILEITENIVSLLPPGTEIAFLPNGDYVLKEESPMEQLFNRLKEVESKWKEFGEGLRNSILESISPPAIAIKMPDDKIDRAKLENSRSMIMPLKDTSTVTFLPETTPTVHVVYRYTYKDEWIETIKGYNLHLNIPDVGESIRINNKEYLVNEMRQVITLLEEKDEKGNTLHEVLNIIRLRENNK